MLNKEGCKSQNPYAKSSRSIERFYISLFGCSVSMLMATDFAIVHVVIIHLIRLLIVWKAKHSNWRLAMMGFGYKTVLFIWNGFYKYFKKVTFVIFYKLAILFR